MNKEVLNTGVQDFIKNNLSADIVSVALSGSPFPGVTASELAEQLAGAQTLMQKAPKWASTPGVYYPPKLHLEQASSQETAAYKSRLIQGKILMDLTGGMGLDSYFFSRHFEQVHYCETHAELAQISAHNFEVLGASNITVHTGDGWAVLEALSKSGVTPDWIYLDPSRRSSSGGRVVRLDAYTPDVTQHLDTLLGYGADILIKTAPMLDLTEGLRTLRAVKEIHVVGVRSEVKELLWWLQPGYVGEARVIATDLGREAWPDFSFLLSEETAAHSILGAPDTYLYEPHAALMKAGPFRRIGARYGLNKLHASSHLYTGPDLIDFPGRRFRILEIAPFKPKKPLMRKGHVVSRNFPFGVAEIRKRARIAPGGDTYLFCTTVEGQGPVSILAVPV